MKILAIETSCDETGIALIESATKGQTRPVRGRGSLRALAASNGINVLANLVTSQTETHRPFGGVVPNLAKREHEKNLPILFRKLQTTNHKLLTDLDLIAVTQGPGLAPCLWTGVNFAQKIAKELNKPLVGINHLKGHIYINILENKSPKPYTPSSSSRLKSLRTEGLRLSGPNGLNPLKFPILSLIVSGGHTQLVFSKKLGHYQIIGETLDDAAGEAFDKVAKLLGLKYPGGPEVSKMAERGDPTRFGLPRPMMNSKSLDFSFSGLKTAVLYLVKGLTPEYPRPMKLTPKNIADLCASFEQAVVDVLVSKTLRAAKNLTPKTLVLGGGVAANKKLRETLELKLKTDFPLVTCLLSPISMTGDNALMIALAALAEYKLLKPLKNPTDLKTEANLRLES